MGVDAPVKLGVLTASVSYKAGGPYESVRRLIQELQARFIPDVQVFGLEDERSQQDRAAWGTLPLQVFGVRGPRAFGYAPGLGPALHEACLDLLQVHGLWMYPSLASLRWARCTKRPYVIRPHGMLDPWALRNSRWKKHLAGWLYESAHLRGAVCLLALCEAEAQAIRALGLHSPIAVVPNGVDLPNGSPDHTDPRRERKVLLYLGRLHPKKGLPNLLRACAMLHQKVTRSAADWKLVIAGWDQNGHEGKLKALCREYGVEQSVHFLGPRFGMDKEETFRAADAFILPSLSEGLPMAILEAWAYGLPVLMTPECNLPEGFQVEAAIRIQTPVDSIIQGLEALVSMTDGERRAMGQRGRKLIEERFSWPKIAAEMHTVYKWVLGGGEQPSCVLMD